ncbi:FACT complex component Spt16 [Protomyces lactucae-debilis]|uniref:FACT complex subunit n=1 Tax=Protomyces lactucae-debilis TaxID=2754530 RepID=A0A1Y2F585_PROLT|nr:FACT complex component Spt16 [Protomyces lactucae-debilis]ORY78644.1 FACT complex component Spt16 [Protomyces lactucae-debilis]
MADVTIDAASFSERLGKLVSLWKENVEQAESAWNGVGSLFAIMGTADEDNPYQKTAALHTWLLGYEFPATTMLLTQDKFYIYTSAGKAKHLTGLSKSSPVPIEILTKTKDEAANQALLEKLVGVLKDGKKMGIFAKDTYGGKAIDEWNAAFKSEEATVEKVDVSAAISPCMAIKDNNELGHIKSAARSSVTVLSDFFVEEMARIVDEERKVTHSRLAEKVEQVLEDSKFVQKIKAGPNFDADQLEWCYTPIIQSGGKYDLRPSAMSNEERLHGGVILCTLGLRYKSYCSNVGRTYFVDPTEEQTKYYDFLVSLQKQALELAKPGTVIKDLYAGVLDIVKSKYPELEPHFGKNIGNGIGIDFRDTSLILNAKNARVLSANMTLNLALGFTNLDNPKGKTPESRVYSLQLVDTIKIQADAPALVLTEAPKAKTDVSFFFNDNADADEAPAKKAAARTTDSSNILPKKTRGVGRPVTESNDQKRKEHQKELAARLHAEGLKRFPDGATTGAGEAPVAVKKFESYRREAQLPSSLGDLKIAIDHRNQSIVVPIFGRPVPFHINVIKNVSKNDEGDFVYLRINLISPGQVIGRKDDTPFEDPNANFIRSLTFRSSDTDRMSEITKEIQEMKKNATKKEAERKELADVVEQDNLIEVKNRRPQKLLDVFVRPGLDGKRVTGELEIQQNGLRYQSPVRSDHRIDILFSNIKHLFFQPCDNELMVIIHVHLKNPIMIGKKKAKDIQFYREASDVQFDETANRKRKYKYGDEDELEAEQEERRNRAKLNKEFRAFSEKISEASEGRIDVDIPFRELGFGGVPFRSNVLLQPTTDCLVHLTDVPFLVVTLSEIEIAHLERIQFGLKNFDMVFVFKDFTKPPVHINTIPMSSLDNVKEWLDSTDIVTSEGPLNLNWATIMKTVNDDPSDFFAEGGWAFLANDSDAEDSDQSESGSEFVGSEAGSFSESASDDDSDFDEDASDDSGSGGGGSGSDAPSDDGSLAEDDESD